MEASQQFHLKWNNHSLNTLSSFQQLLDTNTLVDVTLTCSNGKTVTAHRMVLAACSEYFYQLFKDLPEKHPVIVFKDANEEIVRDLLLFMYKGEVEVQEANLNDFLKFADTLQVKGLSQSDRDVAASRAAANGGNSAPSAATHLPANASSTASGLTKFEASPIKSAPQQAPAGLSLPPGLGAASPLLPTSLPAASSTHAIPSIPLPHGNMVDSLPDMAKFHLAASAGLAGKFPPMFPLPGSDHGAAANDLITQFSSPNLYRALQRQYQSKLGAAAPKFPAAGNEHDSALLKQMPFLKKMFGDGPIPEFGLNPHLFPPQAPGSIGSAASARDDNDNDSIAERSPPPPPTSGSLPTPHSNANNDENGLDSSPMDGDFSTPPPGSDSRSNTPGSHSNADDNTPRVRGVPKGGTAGRGSRLERMIAAEYKILNEFSEQTPEALPVMTPELMKSRRTHSLQLAIGEILHNRASVQSAATKYHIPRETLRRHYQRYLKAMGIQKPPQLPGGSNNGSAPTSSAASPISGGNAVRSSVPTNNNASKNPLLDGSLSMPPTSNAGGDESNGYSSLLDIGHAFGIWGSDAEGGDLKARMSKELESRKAAIEAAAAAQLAAAQAAAMAAVTGGQRTTDEKEKDLVIDEDEDDEEDEECNPGSPEHEAMPSPTMATPTAGKKRAAADEENGNEKKDELKAKKPALESAA